MNILLLYGNLCEKYIYPSNFNDIKYGEIDNSFIYHNKLNKSKYNDFYGSDYYLKTLENIDMKILDFALISTLYYKK